MFVTLLTIIIAIMIFYLVYRGIWGTLLKILTYCDASIRNRTLLFNQKVDPFGPSINSGRRVTFRKP
jgi:hypothetical protein